MQCSELGPVANEFQPGAEQGGNRSRGGTSRSMSAKGSTKSKRLASGPCKRPVARRREGGYDEVPDQTAANGERRSDAVGATAKGSDFRKDAEFFQNNCGI